MDASMSYKDDVQLHHVETHFSNLRKNSLLYVFLPTLVIGSLVYTFVHCSYSLSETSLLTRSHMFESQCPDLDPDSLFSFSLNSALEELSRIRTLPDTLSQRANESRTLTALRDCEGLFEDAYNMVNQTVDVVGGHVAELDRWSVSQVYTWISGGMTDIETCLDGLEEMGSEKWARDELRREVSGSKMWLSKCLAILSDIKSLSEKTISIL